MPAPEISCAELAQKLKAPESQRPLLVDVRTPEEHELVALPHSVLLPLQQLPARADAIATLQGKDVVVYCHHGVRSLQGAAFLRARGVDAVSLAGGIDRYAQDVDPSLPRY